MISGADYEAWQTTRRLFSTPANVRRLLGSIRAWHDGELVTEALPEGFEGDE